MRVNRCKPHRDEGGPQVHAIGHGSVGEARPQRVPLEAAHRPRAPLRPDRGHGSAHGQREERQLLQQEAAKGPPFTLRGDRAVPLQRPKVQEQERARQRDDHRLGQQPERHAQRHDRVPAQPGPLDVTDVSEHREQPKERAQYVLALGRPGHGLGAQRVQREQRRQQRRRPSRAGHAAEHVEDEHRIRGVNQHIHQVVQAGPQPEQLDVDHVRDQRQRVPHARHDGRQRPLEAFPRQTVADHLVVRDVVAVIVGEEAMLQCLSKHEEHRHGEAAADPQWRVIFFRHLTHGRDLQGADPITTGRTRVNKGAHDGVDR